MKRVITLEPFDRDLPKFRTGPLNSNFWLLNSVFNLPDPSVFSQPCVGDNLEGVGVSQDCIVR